MTVMCIRRFAGTYGDKEVIEWPEIGDEDSVTGQTEERGFIFYYLERFDHRNAYRADYFATLPGLSADEMQELEKEAIIK